MEKTL